MHVYKSEPMDPSTMTASDLDNKDKEEDKMFCGGEGKEKMTMVKGGKVIEKTLQDINIIQALSQKEAKATAQDESLRKKLRVDRARKLQFGGSITNNSEKYEMSAPDWVKQKSLEEIKLIRDAKKSIMLENMDMQVNDRNSVKKLFVTPGENQFFTVPITNNTDRAIVYNVQINDPDVYGFGLKPELHCVTDIDEYEFWVERGKVREPENYDIFGMDGDICLNPRETIELLFKYFTSRDCDYGS